MSEFKFDCPHCSQRIQCDELWCGKQLQCPSCGKSVDVPLSAAPPEPMRVTVPPPPAAPVQAAVPVPATPGQIAVPVPGASATKLSINRPQPQQHAPPPAQPAAPPQSRSAPRQKPASWAKPKKQGGAMKAVKIAAVLVVLGVGGYFGFGLIAQWQEKMNGERRKIEKNSDGGELGHIASTYQFLDATEPGRLPTGIGGGGDEESPRRARTRARLATAGGAGAEAPPAEKELPVIPAVWTLDLAAATIPEGRANGAISGSNFVAEVARVDRTPQALVLSLRQGAGPSPDREIVVYLRLKAGEVLPGHTWTVSTDMKGTGVPQVAKRWKVNPRFAPQQKNYATGYTMKLEFGQATDGVIPGKIFIALPDPEQSVVAGLFKVETFLTGGDGQAF